MTRWPTATSLSGESWQFGSVPASPLWQADDIHLVQEWLPATIPGNVESDLLALGPIPDPFVGRQNEAGRWTEDKDWWYRCSLPLSLQPGQRAFLIFRGVDYYSAVFANKVPLGRHEGMFSQQICEVTQQALQRERVEIAIRLWGAHALPPRRLSRRQRWAEPFLRAVAGDVDFFPSRIGVVKCQMSFGWDFAPRMPTSGIWDEVETVVCGPVFVADAWVTTDSITADSASARLHLKLNSSITGHAQLLMRLQAANFNVQTQILGFELDLLNGEQEHEFPFEISSPHLWQPWDRGSPDHYLAAVTVLPPSGRPSSVQTTFGLRSVEMVANQGAASDVKWTFVVNGKNEFVRGANWVPVDALPGRVKEADYEELIELAKQAGINMLRVWGGGLREKRAFYDICDAKGMLVWQDFPFACPNLNRFPSNQAFLDLAAGEVSSIVRTLRHHPSVVAWCGGNEFSETKNRSLIATIRQVTEENDSSRPFIPVSPTQGERHNYRVWHRLAPLSEYLRERAAFVSEFGLQSTPSADAMASFIPAQELWPPSKTWTYHNADIRKLRRYAGGAKGSLEEFCVATQTAQARAIQIMVEHMRRREFESSGVMVWQFNEPWPSISWSVVTHQKQPKLAYTMLQRVFAPLLVSVEYPLRRYQAGDRVNLKLWIIDDRAEGVGIGVKATVRLSLNDIAVYDQDFTMPLDKSEMVGEVTLTLPPQRWLLRAQVWQDNVMLATNEYDLGDYRPWRTPLLQRLLGALGPRFLS